MKILITGGAGFIGSHLVEKLYKKNDIIVIDNLSTGRKENIKFFLDKINFVKADISKIHNIEKFFKGIDIVFHLAALADIVPSIQNPIEYYNSNVTGTINVLKCSQKYKIKFYMQRLRPVMASQQNILRQKVKIISTISLCFNKITSEQLVMHWSKLYKLNSISLRLFNVYGTRSRTSGTYGAMFGVFLAQKLANAPLTIVGNGKQTRDFTYVSDVVEAFIKASNSKISGEIFNVGSGKTVSVNKIVSMLSKKKIYIKKRPGEPDCTFADIRKKKKFLKWKPKINIKLGIDLILKNINGKKAPVWTEKRLKL